MEETKELDLLGLYIDEDTLFIKANPNGLRRFAYELNEIAREWDESEWSEVVPNENRKHHFKWMQGELPIAAIFEVTDLNDMKTTITSPSKDWLFKIGCWLLVILFLLPFFAGLQTIYNWFF